MPSRLLAASYNIQKAIGTDLRRRPERIIAVLDEMATDAGVSWFVGQARRGVDVQILTNALEATDVAAVHAGYAPHRTALLDAGVGLWELKAAADADRQPLRLGAGSTARPALSASSPSLHAKTFAVDDERLFVGSFNFDPRSVALNTELGFLIDSPALATAMRETLAQKARQRAYTVRNGEDGLVWEEQESTGKRVVHTTEPGTTAFQRGIVRVMSWLPIEGFVWARAVSWLRHAHGGGSPRR
jgi:putative cardiolipin synthase